MASGASEWIMHNETVLKYDFLSDESRKMSLLLIFGLISGRYESK